jgi:FtsZ-binding cell division protein ZapB
VLSDLCYQLQRRCLCQGCTNLIPDLAPLHKRYCKALCRANAWSRANRDFRSRITAADFENIRKQIKEFEVRIGQRVLWYALIAAHPVIPLAHKIGESIFPPKDRKTKRSPDDTGKICFSDTPYYSFTAFFETPRVPRVGLYQVKVWLEGDTAPIVTGQYVDVRKAFPSVHFYDEKTGQRYTLKGEVIPPKAPKPLKPPTERRKRRPPAAIGPQPEREASTERVSELVPAVVAQRAPDAELDELSKKFEDERQRFTKERTDLLATISREQTLRRDLEQKLLRATSVPKVPVKDDGLSRLRAAENRALGEQVKKLGESLSKLQARVTEVEKDKASLTRERDDVTKERDALTKERDELKVKVAEQQVGNATLARQIITLEDRAKKAESERTELVERPRDAKPDQAATAAPAATADTATADAGAASTPPSSPTGVVIHRLAFGGNLPPASSPKSGPPSIGILGQNHRSPIRGGANKKHKRR